MPDNPAVRAVAAGFAKASTFTASDGCSMCGDYPWGLARQALAALASSQEVRGWLTEHLMLIFGAPHRYDARISPDGATKVILNALGGGE